MYDTIIKGGRWFDGTGAASAIRHLGIRDGRVVTVSAAPLDEQGCARVIDATDRWVLPGMIDIHTHYDVEVLGSPQLSESLRHGITTVLLGSCSISTVHVGPRVWHRDFFDAEIVDCPDPRVIGKTFGQVGLDRGGLHPVDAFLDLVVEHGDKVRWRTTISNHRPHVLDRLASHPGVHLGFSDAGAHLRNMAFYNFGLRFLRRVHEAERAGRPFLSLERAVHRMTGELADWYGLDAGHLRQGDRADVVVIDPAHLDAELDRYAEAPVAQYDNLSRMVNRNDAAVSAVLVGGEFVFGEGRAGDSVGVTRTGRFLRAR
ncbi:amidohydrolase family protein [Nocardia farcinica]|uniref:hypothetical protein n=1 Tax=Nocardia farcinica TaxID=37329 RepID=UPI00311FF2D1